MAPPFARSPVGISPTVGLIVPTEVPPNVQEQGPDPTPPQPPTTSGAHPSLTMEELKPKEDEQQSAREDEQQSAREEAANHGLPNMPIMELHIVGFQ